MMMWSGRMARLSRARCIARMLALRILMRSISSAVTMPRAHARASRSMISRRAYRRLAVSCLLSLSSSLV